MAARSSRLEVRLLGPPEVFVDGRALQVDTRKAIALLAYLTERDSSPTRDELTWLLWPESSADRGRGALRRTISSLRSGLDGRWVSADRERVHLDRDGIVVDTKHLDTPAGLDAVRGRFMDGFYLRDAAPFDDWQATTASHYDRILRAALEERTLERLARGDHRGAVADAETRLAIDPLDESSHRLLMRAFAMAGDRAAAIRQYRACAAILDEELAVEPLPETSALNEAILAGDLAPPPTPEPVGPVPTDGPVITLTDLGLESAAAALRKRTATPGTTRVLGPVGSGRTRLVAEALPNAVLVTAFPSDAEIPHGLSRSMLLAASAGHDSTLDERAAPAVLVAPDLADRAPEPPALEGDLAEGRLLDGVAVAIAQLLGDRVLAIDDAHLADRASRSVVERLVERSEELGARIVVTGTGSNGPRSIAMPALAPEIVTDLAARLGHDADTGVAVLRGTGGWAGHVIEALTSPNPAAAVEAIRRRRILELDAVARQVLEALAVLESGTIGAISDVSGRPGEEVAGALDRLASSGLVSERDGSHAPAAHWVVPAVVDELGPARRALLHGRAADVAPQSEAARARHLEAAGRTADAARAHVEAGREAMAVLAHDAASRHVRAAIALGHPDPGGLHFLLGEVETRAGNYPAALGAFNAAAAEGTNWRIESAIGDVYARWGRWQLASASLAAALDLADSADQRATILADLAVVAVRDGRDEDARSLVTEALASVDDDAEVAARVANVAGLVLDDPEHLLRAIAHARRTSRREDEAAALNNLALAYARRDRMEEAVALAERSLALLDRTGDRHRRAAIHGNLADILHDAGDEEASREHLRRAASLFAEVGVGDWEPEIWKLTGW